MRNHNPDEQTPRHRLQAAEDAQVRNSRRHSQNFSRQHHYQNHFFATIYDSDGGGGGGANGPDHQANFLRQSSTGSEFELQQVSIILIFNHLCKGISVKTTGKQRENKKCLRFRKSDKKAKCFPESFCHPLLSLQEAHAE